MFEYINTINYYLFNSFYILFFCYLYSPLYKSCNVQKKITKKNGKNKIISQPKSVLALTYLILLYSIFRCFTFKIILLILTSIITTIIILVDNFTPTLNNFLHNLNKTVVMIIFWKLIHTIFTLVYILTEPIFSIINNYLDKKMKIFKKIFTQIANLNLSDKSKSNSDLDLNFNKEMLKLGEEISCMSDYIFKSQKSNQKETKHHKNIISEINSDPSNSFGDSSDLNIFEKKDCPLENNNINKHDFNLEENKLELNNMNKIEINNSESNISSSKLEMEKKIDEINQVINEVNNEIIEDMTLTVSEHQK